MTNWLVSSAGRRGHLIEILRETSRVMGGGSVVAIDCSPLAAAGLLADTFEIVPRADDPAFVDRVLQICGRHGINHLIPTIDPELPVYAAARPRFAEAGVEAWVSSPEVVALGHDKWLFHQWLRQHGFTSPATAEVTNSAVADLRGPVVAKPRGGSSSIGLVWAPAIGELSLDQFGEDYLVQEIALGYEVAVDFAVDGSGELRGMSARRQLEARAGDVSKAVTIDHLRLREAIERFVGLLPGAFGILNVQVFVDDHSGLLTFLELNARVGGGYPLSWQAGATFPLWLAQNEQPEVQRQDARPGVVMLRYEQAVFEEAAHFGESLAPSSEASNAFPAG